MPYKGIIKIMVRMVSCINPLSLTINKGVPYYFDFSHNRSVIFPFNNNIPALLKINKNGCLNNSIPFYYFFVFCIFDHQSNSWCLYVFSASEIILGRRISMESVNKSRACWTNPFSNSSNGSGNSSSSKIK